MQVIVSTYKNNYEWIHTESTPFMLAIKIKYLIKGYSVWSFPTIGMAKIWYKMTGKRIYKGTDVFFEKYVPNTDQITWHTPYNNNYLVFTHPKHDGKLLLFNAPVSLPKGEHL